MKCSYCKKEFNKGWLGFMGTCQCNRILCRLKTGHLKWSFNRFCIRFVKKIDKLLRYIFPDKTIHFYDDFYDDL